MKWPGMGKKKPVRDYFLSSQIAVFEKITVGSDVLTEQEFIAVHVIINVINRLTRNTYGL